jgi:superfamily II DNA helicase RecQ
MPPPQETMQPKKAPSHDEIRRKTFEQFGFVPCLWQIRVVEAILKHNHDVVSIAATGSGKTLTFWMPLLFCEGGIQIVISPLNLLGKQNVDELTAKCINAIAVTAKNANSETFQVHLLPKHL